MAVHVADLQASIAFLNERFAMLKEELEKAKKDSSTSSKPPSSDIVNSEKKDELHTLFRIDTLRDSQVIIGTLGEEFDGALGCDYFGA